MLTRKFTIEECQQFKHCLNKYWQTRYPLQTDDEVILGQQTNGWVFTTLQNLATAPDNLTLEIEPVILAFLSRCLHYTICTWLAPESNLYLQLCKFLKEFVEISTVELPQPVEQSKPQVEDKPIEQRNEVEIEKVTKVQPIKNTYKEKG